MKLRRKLFSNKYPYDLTKSELFLAACKENYKHLITHCEDYKKISDGLGIHSADDIKNTLEELKEQDFIFVDTAGYSPKDKEKRDEMKHILDAAKDAKVLLRLVEFRTQGKDHPILPYAPETQYLKCGIYQVFPMNG